MADIVTTFIPTVMEFIAVEARRHISEVASVKEELEKLVGGLETIRPIYEDAHDKQFTSKYIKDWISKVHHIIYDAEDIIDLYKAKTRDLDAQTGQGKVRAQLSSASFMCRNLLFLHKTASDIKNVTKRLKEAYEQKDKYGLVPLAKGLGPPQCEIEILCSNRLTTSNITEQNIVGREIEEKLFVEWLKKSISSECSCHVGAIVGTGGLGKTTLAKKVYNNLSIKEHFEKSVWICASERPQLRQLLKQILEGLSGKERDADEKLELETLNREIGKYLKEKRFLLVIDDSWDCGWWGELNGLLQQGAPGSRVLVTSREKNIAMNIDAAFLHELKYLSYEDSWYLFVKKF